MRSQPRNISAARAVGVFYALSIAGPAPAQSLSGESLVRALRGGGHVIVTRHASSPREAPDKQVANPDNSTLERQLDAAGRAGATTMGKSFRRLQIPVGAVLSSPAYRALETIRYAQFGKPQTHPELGDGGRSMQGGTEVQAMWLRERVAQFPQGTNTLIVTHQPNIAGAFPQSASGLAEGESLIFVSDGKGGSALVGRVKIEEWSGLR